MDEPKPQPTRRRPPPTKREEKAKAVARVMLMRGTKPDARLIAASRRRVG